MCVAVYLHSLRLCSDQQRRCGKSPAHAPSSRALRLDPAVPSQSVHAAPPNTLAYHAKCVSSAILKAIYHVAGRQVSYQLSHRTHYGVRGCTVTCLLALSRARCRTTHGGNTIKRSNGHHRRQRKLPCMQMACQKDSWEREEKAISTRGLQTAAGRERCFHWRDPGFSVLMEILI